MNSSVHLYRVPCSLYYTKQTGLSNQGLIDILNGEISRLNQIWDRKLKDIENRFIHHTHPLSFLATCIDIFQLAVPTLYNKMRHDGNGTYIQRKRNITVYAPFLAFGLYATHHIGNNIIHVLSKQSYDPGFKIILGVYGLYYFGLRAADMASNYCENKLALYFKNKSLAQKEQAIMKIKSVIDRLSIFPDKWIDISSLKADIQNLNLSSTVQHLIVSGANFSQLRELKTLMPTFVNQAAANAPSDSTFTPKKYILKRLDALADLTPQVIIEAINDLKGPMLQDPTLWTEIIKSLTPEQIQGREIKELLYQLGKQIVQPQDMAEKLIEILQDRSHDPFTLCMEGSPATYEISHKFLFEYRFFQALMSKSFKEPTTPTVEIAEENMQAFPYLVKYMQNLQVDVPLDILPRLQALASQLQIYDCASDCQKCRDSR